MKPLITLLFSITLLSSAALSAQEQASIPETADAATYQASIMAFGVSAEQAAIAAQAALDAIAAQHAPLAEKVEAPPTLSTSWLSNPYLIRD